MYGGLFGDLPAASNSKGDGEAEGSKKESEGDDGGNVPTTSANSNDTAATKQQASLFVPGRVQKLNEPKKKDSKASSSVVKSLGTTGTSMAFIPAAARRKKTPPAPAAASTTSNSINSSAEKTQREGYSNPFVSSTSTAARTLTSINVEPFKVVVENNTAAASSSKTDDETPVVSRSEHQHDSSRRDNQSQQQQQHHGENEEPESLRRLHEEAAEKDPYDPMFPNDLLQYWESKAFEKERQRLEKEHRESLEQQEKLKRQLEKEREDLARSGNLEKLAEHHQNMEQQQRERQRVVGGRGRGLSNLPAWLVEKKKQEERTGSGAGTSSSDLSKRQRLNDDR